MSIIDTNKKTTYTFHNNNGISKYNLLVDAWKFSHKTQIITQPKFKNLGSVTKRQIIDYFSGLISENSAIDGKDALFSNDKICVGLHWSNNKDSFDLTVKTFTICFYTSTIEENENCQRDFLKHFKEIQLVSSPTSAEWYYVQPNGELNYVRLQINVPENFHPELYPFIPNVNQYIQDFLNSSSNVLIFTGDPGLGKSSLIKHIIANFEQEAIIAYDQEVMKMDRLYLDFLESDASLLVLEDADLLLSSRKEAQNAVMSKILNVSDGILSSSHKKFIFTANIKNTSDIDPALIRPGRCFDVKMFRPLTQSEAVAATKALGKDMPEKQNEYTLAEIFNRKVSTELQNSIGFGFGN